MSTEDSPSAVVDVLDRLARLRDGGLSDMTVTHWLAATYPALVNEVLDDIEEVRAYRREHPEVVTQAHTPRVAPAEALDRMSQAQRAGVDDAFLLGAIAAMDPALVVRAVEKALAQVKRTEVEES